MENNGTEQEKARLMEQKESHSENNHYFVSQRLINFEIIYLVRQLRGFYCKAKQETRLSLSSVKPIYAGST